MDCAGAVGVVPDLVDGGGGEQGECRHVLGGEGEIPFFVADGAVAPGEGPARGVGGEGDAVFYAAAVAGAVVGAVGGHAGGLVELGVMWYGSGKLEGGR